MFLKFLDMFHILRLHPSSVQDEDLEILGKLLTSVESFTKVNPTQSTIGMNLDASRLKVSGPVGSACEVGQIDLHLIPTGIQTQRHGAIEGPDPGTRLEIAGPETSLEVSIVQDFHLEGKVAFQILHNEDQEWEPDPKTFPGADRRGNVGRGHIVPNDFQRDGTDAGVRDAFDVAIVDPGTPNAQRFPADGVENGEKSGLVGVSEHFKNVWAWFSLE